MSLSLKHNLTSAYLDAAQRLSPKKARRRIVAYVESYEDVAFWRALLAEFEDEHRYFQVMLPSATSLSKGKKVVLTNTLNTEELGRSLIACVDSDYDFLMQGSTEGSRKVNTNPYIFQTYAYAIENYQCFAESLHEVCVQATLNDRHVLNFEKFLTRYSRAAYPLFLWHLWFHKRRDTRTLPMCNFHSFVRLQEVDIRHPYRCLEEVERQVEKEVKRLRAAYSKHAAKVEQLGKELEGLGLVPDTAYLYMQGHHLMDNVVMKLLVPVCNQLRREREEEIRRLAGHNKQMLNELTSYEHSQVSVSVVLKKNIGYRNLYLYQWLRKDIEKFLEEL